MQDEMAEQTEQQGGGNAGGGAPIDLLRRVATDPDLERKGVVMEYGGVRWRVASADRRDYQRAQRRCIQQHAQEVRKGVTVNEQIAFVAPAVAEHLLVGWEGDLVLNGAPLPNTLANRTKILTDPRFFDFLRRIVNFANDADNFRATDPEDDAGN